MPYTVADLDGNGIPDDEEDEEDDDDLEMDGVMRGNVTGGWNSTRSNSTSFRSGNKTSSVNSTNAISNSWRLKSNTTSAYSSRPIPLGLLKHLPIYTRGIASSGTVEFVGRDAAPEVISGGEEGQVRVDVVVQYGGSQDVQGIMRICGVRQGDGGAEGVGVYVSVDLCFLVFAVRRGSSCFV